MNLSSQPTASSSLLVAVKIKTNHTEEVKPIFIREENEVYFIRSYFIMWNVGLLVFYFISISGQQKGWLGGTKKYVK